MLRKLLLTVMLSLGGYILQAQVISGTVYRDYNGNGVRETGSTYYEPGAEGVLITAYDGNNSPVATAISAGDGTYSMPYSVPVRVEFQIQSGNFCTTQEIDATGFSGDGNGVRFVNAATSTLNYAVLAAEDFVANNNPKTFVPMYKNGDPTGAGAGTPTESFFTSYDWNSSSSAANQINLAASEIGTVYGVAYSKQAKKVFAAAFLKRHVGLGPLGSGGIYMLEPNGSGFTKTNFYDMDANGYRTRASSSAPAYGSGSSFNLPSNTTISFLGATDPESGFPEGMGVIGSNTDRGLTTGLATDNYDPAAFSQVGKVGLGDLDISDDGKFLFVMNLYSRKVYRLELNDAYNPTAVINVTSYSIPSVTANLGEFRCFGLGYHRGKLYVGGVTTGEYGGQNTVGGATDLYAYVFEMNDPKGSATFNSTPVITYPLNYLRGYIITTLNSAPNKKWFPWTGTSSSPINDGFGESIYPMPMLSDVDFTDEGAMVMNFFDRGGHVWGYRNYRDLQVSTTQVLLDVGGDILVAGKDCSTGAFTLENNGSYTTSGQTFASAGVANTEGPGGGEFYFDERPTDNYHHEASMGSMAFLRGSRKGIFTLMDANSPFAGGTTHFSSVNGAASNRLNLYAQTPGSFEKANGLGDIEISGDEPGIEIGNRVWVDLNNDGIQGPGEIGLNDVEIVLYADFNNDQIPDGPALATVTTLSDGNYYFNPGNVIDGDPTVALDQPGPQPGKTYLICVGGSDWTSGAGINELAGLSLATANVGGSGQPDVRDNDAILQGTIPCISVTTGKLGQNNHTLDFGFVECTADAGPGITLTCSSPSGTIGTPAVSGNTYLWTPSTGLSADNIAQPTASPSSTTTYTLTVNGLCTDQVTVTVDNTPPTADAGNNLNLNCTTTSGVIGTSAIAGNTYLWIPNSNLSADNIAQPTANPTTTTTYTVTVTGSNGCTATDVVTVNVDTTPPVADAGSNMTVDCNNASVTIGTAAIGGYTYLWSPNTNLSADNIAQPVANPGSSISYTVTVTGANGCTATDVVDVNVDLVPPTPGISGNTTVCNNGTTLLTASGGVGYSWNPSGANTASILGTTGTYTVTVTGSNGCTATSSVTINSVEGSIGNYVWYDANGNGIFDENPTLGINNITVELWKETAPSSGIYTLDQTTTTANNLSSEPGYYQFIICESANYKVKFPLSSGGQPLTTQTATAGTDNNSDPDRTTGESPVVAIDVNGSGIAKDNNTIDAAYYKPAQLGNYVWHDVDKDGIQDGNEVGVSGVTVTLYNSANNAIVGATVTDAYGYYKFNPLAPGTYYVGFTVPANYIITSQDQTADAADSDPNATSGLTGNYTIVAGDSNMTVDAGIYVPGTSLACLGDKVWMDMDQDGIQDANEVGVAGVTVTLNNASGDPIATTITNANGLYAFCDLQPGTYSVTFSRPIGYVLTNLDLGGDDTQDSDADPITGQTSTVTLIAGDNNLTLDAGIYPQTPTNAGLGNYVWNDVNNNGIQDANETGVAGVTVTLYGPDGTTVIGTTVTDELGYYIFNNLTPGTYVVGFSNLPAGFSFSNPDQGGNDTTDSDPDSGTGKTAPVSLTSGEFNLTLDAGIHNPTLPTAALGNYVWFDWNKNGVQDATENGVAGVTVTLYASDGTTVLDNTVTNLNGFYLFDNLAAGSYVVGFSNIPNGFSFTTTDQGGNDATDSDPDLITSKTPVIGLANGEVNLTLDAGIIENSGKNNLGSLGDRVWFDDNQNGIQDVGENGVSGVTVTLYQADGTTVIQTKETDVLGNYIFTGLGAGAYVVGFSNIPGGYTFTTANQGSDDALDADADATSSGKTPVVNLALGEENLTLDAGIFAAPGLASLGNYVWIDVDQDGVQDANEPGVAGVTVTLFDNAGNQLQTTTTDPNGLYQFTGLTPDTYSVGFSNLPSGYELTTADQGGNDTQDSDADVATGLTPSVTLNAGQNYPDFDAGIFTNLASLGNYVWNDLDQDGIQDPLEEGIPGITVTLYAADGITPISSAVTNAAGFYNFVNLIPGTYVVGFSNIPNGAQFSPANQGSDDALDSDAEITDGKTTPVTLSAGEYNPTLDAGIFTPLGAGLGDFVWFDLSNDGQQDANEPGVPGVTAILNDAGGNPIKSTITDANGYYTFPNLPPGTYSVTFTTLPYNRLFTSQNSGSDAGDNDVVNIVNLPSGYPQSGTTPTYTLAAGEYNPTIDAGMFTGIPLSVNAIHATATLQGQNSRVQWVTTDEKNVDHFEIERSITGSQFVKVATHAALGNTQGEHAYQISDDVADLMSEPVIYYRVKVMDIDGRFVYSNITSVRPAVSGQLNAYPSPFTASFTIGYTSENDGEVDIVLTDMAGRKVLSQTRQVKEGTNHLTISGLQGLAAGQYSVRIKDFNTDAEFVLKVEKQ